MHEVDVFYHLLLILMQESFTKSSQLQRRLEELVATYKVE